VRASSINRGELRLMAMRPNGWIPGQDVAGVVERAASDGSGQVVGARVAALVDQSAWAERVAVPNYRLAELPANVSFEATATLPMAGKTAMRTLRPGGNLCGQAVLVTGASGAVGRFQVQLAYQQGASVTGIASAAHAEELRALGAANVVVSIEAACGTFALITESVGGASLAQAIERIAPGGTIVVFGSSRGELTPFGFRQFVPGHEGARIQTFMSYASGPGFGSDIAALVDLVSAGQLDARVAPIVPWAGVAVALDALRGRTISGKVVLTVTE
jgi:NADPH2:quinone reductase